MGNHITTILLLPLLFSALPSELSSIPCVFHRAAWMSTGLLIYLILPLRARVTVGLLLDQASLPGLILAVVGLAFFFKPSALHRNAVWIMISSSAFAVVYGTLDSFVYLMHPAWGFRSGLG